MLTEDTNIDNATKEELQSFLKDNGVAFNKKANNETLRNLVTTYMEDPNKIIVPFMSEAEADAKAKADKEKADAKASKISVKDEDRLKAIFDKNPMAKSIYKTADGFMFLEQGDANFHAKTLKDQKVSVHQRA